MLKQKTKKRTLFLLTLMGFLAITTPVRAAGPDDKATSAMEINAANKLLRDGEVDSAVERYAGIAVADEHREQLNFNLGVGHYRKGEIEAARPLFEQVAGSANASLAASGRYNLGNCQYATALQTAETDKAAAIEQLKSAIAHYRGSLRANIGNEDARANIELAAELIRRLEAELKQQQQDQQQQDQQQQDQQQQDQQQQNQQQGENQQDSSQQQQDSSSEEQETDGQQQKQDPGQNSSESSQSEEAKDDASQGSDPSKSENEDSQSSESKDPKQNPSEQNQSETSETMDDGKDGGQENLKLPPSPSQRTLIKETTPRLRIHRRLPKMPIQRNPKDARTNSGNPQTVSRLQKRIPRSQKTRMTKKRFRRVS